jgi:very-short-patch-repair endonuclease
MVEAATKRDRKTYFPKRPSSEALSRGRKAYWLKLSAEERVARLTSFIEAGQRHNKKSSRTRIEESMADLLDELGLGYERNIRIGRYVVDFIVGDRVIIECFGDYWHCNPEIYGSDYYHHGLHMSAGEKWRRDAERRAMLEMLGYISLHFWESDIESRLHWVKGELAPLIKDEILA